MAKEKKLNTNYVDKQVFYDLLMVRRAELDEAEMLGEPKPQLNDEIGKIIFDIATNLSYRYNFINYTYRDEMVGDAIETCIRYVDNFDPEKSKNPFGYYTQICYFSFVRRINKEAQQQDIRKKMIKNIGVDESFATQQQDADGNFSNTCVDFAQEHLV